MRDFSALDEVPDAPAVYVLFSGRKQRYVAYVGVAGQLRSRLKQHFFRRDSSVTTGAAAVSLNPEKVCALTWWQHESFHDRDVLEAAEEVAFGEFEPTLRSRGGVRSGARSLLGDEAFVAEMRALLSSPAHGDLEFPSLADVHRTVKDLQEQLSELRLTLEQLKSGKE